MKKTVVGLLLCCISCMANSQQRIIDSLRQHTPLNNDTLLLTWYNLASEAFSEVNNDSSIHYAKKYVEICKKLDYPLHEADAYTELSGRLAATTPANSLDLLYRAKRMLEQTGNKKILPVKYLQLLKVPASTYTYPKYHEYLGGKVNWALGFVYWMNNRNQKSVPYFMKSLETAQSLPAADLLVGSYMALGVTSPTMDSMLMYLKKAHEAAIATGETHALGNIEAFMTYPYNHRKDYKTELYYKRASLQHNMEKEKPLSIGWSLLGLGEFYKKSILINDSAIYYGHKAFRIAQDGKSTDMEYWAARLLFEVYKEEGLKDSTFKYMEKMVVAKDKTTNDDDARLFENTEYTQQMQEDAIEAARQQLRNKVKMYSLLAGMGLLVLVSAFFWRNSKRKKQEFLRLEKQKEITDRALQELKATQAQLIQSEKMASLGELTAGIAHEIQNPLNFVNNFSEVNEELIDELYEQFKQGDSEQVKKIANDLKQNLEKISHHGKRADAIVKGMLLHSRSSSGQKEPTDINALADEYLRLAYHGLRAKDKSFQAKFETSYDPTLQKLNVVPQDIGRVLLNLINNAFYAVTEKKKHSGKDYEPGVLVSTKKTGDTAEIRIKDNGDGINPEILDKIFQPFFTTKPTGQGTGLGLSMSYDIIKAHGGDLKVTSVPSAAEKKGGTEFIISLPPGKG